LQQQTNGSNGSTALVDDATELFRRHASGLYHYCFSRLHSPEEAEDAVQATYLKAWRSLRQGVKPEQGRAWLYQIAANVCSDALRARLGGTRLELRDPIVLDEVRGLDDVGNEELVGLPEALRELPERQRDALLLRDWKGLSYDEIAAEMSVSGSAVETLLFRARNRVAAALSNSDWRRKVAPTGRALLLWPVLFLRPKDASAGVSGEQFKMALVLAGGTVAPLVAFGVFQATLVKPDAPNPVHRPPAVVDTQRPPSAPWLTQGTLVHPTRSTPRDTANTPSTDDRKNPHARKKHEGGRPHGGGQPSPAAGPGPVHPSPPDTPAPGPTQPPGKVVICHATPADAKPGVTISVSAHALRGLGSDPAGACD
jgi:RNA polymerase sigma factor (sigma-70 family)